jgi:hypothetical protein
MKITELIQRVQSLYSKGVQSRSSRLSSRHIYSKLVSSRQRLISQQLRKKQKISDWNYLVLPCVELIKVPNHECPCAVEIGCDVFRTKLSLPKTLTNLDSHIIEYVMSVENSLRIEEVSRTENNFSKGNKYTGSNPKYIIEKGHLYFPMRKSPGIVTIKFLPEDPIEAYNYPSLCECTDCNECESILDKEFPIDGDMIDTLIEMAVAELIEIFYKMTEDITNNSVDSSKDQTK